MKRQPIVAHACERSQPDSGVLTPDERLAVQYELAQLRDAITRRLENVGKNPHLDHHKLAFEIEAAERGLARLGALL